MSTTRTRGPALDETWRQDDLPPLTTLDRPALRIGLALIARGQRRPEAERAEHARRDRAAADVARIRDAALTHRFHAGPTTW